MNFTEMVAIIEEAIVVLEELKKDGTYDKLLLAEQAIVKETQNPKIQTLLSKLKQLKL